MNDGFKDAVISLLNFVVLISFFLVIVFSAYSLKSLGIDYFWGAIIGVMISTLSHGIVILAIRNNELLKEIRDKLNK